MARGPRPTLLMAAARPGSKSRKPPGPVWVVRMDNEDAQAALVRGTDLALAALTPAFAGLYIGHPRPGGLS